MDRLRRFALRRPLAFSLAIIVVFVFILLAATVLGNRWTDGSAGRYLAGMSIRLLGIFLLVLLIARMGWLRSAGFTRPGRLRIWLAMLLPLVYAIAVSAYAMTGGFDFSVTDLSQTLVGAGFILAAAFLEEVVFRGLILQAFLHSWGFSRRGQVTSVLVSSSLFALYHWINLLDGTPLAEVALQSLVAFSLGLMLAALFLVSNSIYPAVVFHFLLNLAGYLVLANTSQPASASAWLSLSLLMLPLAILGLYLSAARRQSFRPLIEERYYA